MTRDLGRLLRPKTVAVIGGGAWCRSVIQQLKKAAYDGAIWPVHPRGGEIDGISVYQRLNDLPSAPDASFVGINRDATIDTIAGLRDMGAGGAVCFASGFAEVDDGHDLNARLLAAAGDMPILGPNCYGMINAVDGALLWPDQHGCLRVDRGVAILTQSSNIAINLTMQNRSLPIAYVVTCGNQAQTTQAEIDEGLLDDPRVTAIGLHIEGFGDPVAWERFARKARARDIPIVALKVGKSEQSRTATVSHTASLAGSDAGAQALMDRLGIARVADLPTLLETLKMLHVAGPLASNRLASISCSGGEASLAADTAFGRDIVFPPLNERQREALFDALGPKVTLANPLDYHTYIWRDASAMTRAFSAMVDPSLALTLLIVDFPRPDRCDPSDWECVVQAALDTRAGTGGKVAMVTTLPELLPEDVAQRLIDGGVVPLNGLTEAIAAAGAAVRRHLPDLASDLPSLSIGGAARTLTEAESKAALAHVGVQIATGQRVVAIEDAVAAAVKIGFPVVLKGEGFAHKSEANAVVLALDTPDAVRDAAAKMAAGSYLVESQISGGIAELLVGVVKDPAHGFVLTVGAGGTLTEVWQDTASCLIPASDETLNQCLNRLKVSKILAGFRGKPAVDRAALLSAIRGIQDYVLANAGTVEEVEVNPLICTQSSAIAADALIRRTT